MAYYISTDCARFCSAARRTYFVLYTRHLCADLHRLNTLHLFHRRSPCYWNRPAPLPPCRFTALPRTSNCMSDLSLINPPSPPSHPQLPVEGDASTLVCKPFLLFPRRLCNLNLSQVYSAHVVQCARSLAEVLADTHTKVPVRFRSCRRATSLASSPSTRSPSWPTPLQL